jgi:hypothetical protein
LLAAVFVRQNDRKLGTGSCRFEDILIAVAFGIQDKSFKFFIDLEYVGGDRHAVVVSLAFVFIDDDFHFSSASTLGVIPVKTGVTSSIVYIF